MPYILVIEDNQANADLIIRTLQGVHFQVRHTTHGLEAIQLVHAERPDLILVDFDLPDIDGRNLVRLFKKQLGGKASPPIVAVTARTSDADIETAQRYGCAAFVAKPFLPEDLLKVIQQFLQPSRNS